MASFNNKKKDPIPETVTGVAGTAKRNIIRKVNKGSGGSNKKLHTPGNSIDDGSTYYDGGVLDEGDPNYDSEAEDEIDKSVAYESKDESKTTLRRSSVATATMTLTKYKKIIELIITEYFISDNMDEAIDALNDIDVPQYIYEFIKKAVNMSFDKGDRERESVSKLFSYGYPDTFSSSSIGKGFERLFELIDEINKDVPVARDWLATYVARAVLDEIIPPSFLSDAVICNLGGDIIVHSKAMLSRDHAGAKLEKSWGPGDGRLVDELKVSVDQLLQEYLLSNDYVEAARCIKELQSPHFYHEVVKRAVVQGVDKSTEGRQRISFLLQYLVEEDLLTKQQAVKGFNRLHAMVSDMQLDTPNASAVLNEFTANAVAENVLPADYVPPTTGV